MTEEPTSEIDTLMHVMSLTGDELTKLSKQDLDKIIAYQRKQRMVREAGGKTKKATGEAPAVDIKALMSKIQKPTTPATFTPIFPKPIPRETPPSAPPKGFIRRI